MSARKRVRKHRRYRDLLAIGALTLAVLALISIHSTAAGVIGNYLATSLRWAVGQAADLPPILLCLWAWWLLRGKTRVKGSLRGLAIGILSSVVVAAIDLIPSIYEEPAGIIGAFLGGWLVEAFGFTGAWVVLVSLTLVALILLIESPAYQLLSTIATAVSSVFRIVANAVMQLFSKVAASWQNMSEARSKRRELRQAARAEKAARREEAEPELEPEPAAELAASSAELVTDPPHSSTPEFTDPFKLPIRGRARAKQQHTDTMPASKTETKTNQTAPADQIGCQQPIPAIESTTAGVIQYRLPPLTIFKRSKEPASRRKGPFKDQSAMLEETLASFGVEVKVVDVRHGPVVTRYELQPAPGVQVRRITSLADDLALNLAAAGVRIEAPVPGKSVVGIEVPNKEPAKVLFREVVESDTFSRARSRLSFVVGMDIAGTPVVGDLTRLLHVLIGGATGSGKSVCLNSIICSILTKAKPHEVKLLLVDPKRVELAVYDGIPHLMAPVVTDAKLAAGALRWAVKEMENRYKIFAEQSVRNIDAYNQQVLRTKNTGEEPAQEALPHIVIVIDELADLMMVAKNDVEDSICRLAQMARAAGMFLLIATQRPSVDVITGLIKANVPSRIAFKVSANQDSRTILDRIGAERLLGKGDMLYFPIGLPEPIRVQGAFISDKEVQAVVDFWKSQGSPEYQEEVFSIEVTESEAQFEDNSDELLADAARLVVETGNASISMIQRRFRVGYARAARLMDMLELRGVVGCYQGSKAREVLKTMEELEEIVF